MEEKKGKIGSIISGAEQLSLGISIVVAILIGVGLGFWIKAAFNFEAGLWIGVILGILAALLNIKKAYDKQKKSLDELKDENRYKQYKNGSNDDEL